MKLVKVGAAVLNQTPLAWEHNTHTIVAALRQARVEGVHVLCLPEMCIPGYGAQDMFHSPSVQRTSYEVLRDDILPETRGLIASVGLPVMWRNGIYNAAAMLIDGHLAGFVCKRYLAGDGVHYEPRWFKPWPAGARGEVTLDGQRYPIGDLSFDCSGIRVGFEICEDAWVAARPGSTMAGLAVDIILNPSASHFAFGKRAIRERFVIEGSRAFAVTYVYANLLGNDSGRIIYDGGAMIASQGRLVAQGPRFGFSDWHLTTALVDVEQTRMVQSWTNSFRPSYAPDEMVHAEYTWPRLEPEAPAPTAAAAPLAFPDTKEENFTRAQALGLYDYLRRSRSRGFVISLSGGADSSACAALVAMMVKLVVAEVGLAGLKDKLGYIAGVAAATTADEVVPALLTTAYQATRNSGETTRRTARELAAALGARHLEMDVDALVEGYKALIAGAIGRELSWDTDDIALQNIQARTRSPSIWMLANLSGSLLISTSNRSEAAVGYATMDGDTSGGISPIAGIDKAFLRHWLRWAQTDGPVGIGRTPALAGVNALQPTAELRPPAQEQTDEGDLMPYDLLDAIEGAAIRDKQDLPPHAGRLPALRAAPARRLGRALLSAVVPQPVEARAVRPLLPRR
jgi:NAD+ synthase (glutamine-hydrolysing)